MEAVEFIRTIQKMCAGTDCDVCPLNDKNGCNVCYEEDPVESVRIVEEWAAEQERQKAEQERQKAEQKRQNPEQERQKAEQDNLEGAIYRAISSNKTRIENLEYDVSVMRNNLAELHDKTYAMSKKFDHTPTKEASQTQEPKRTNKDVLLAAFPDTSMDNDGIPNVCPYLLDTHYNCDKSENCLRCTHTYWLSEVEK